MNTTKPTLVHVIAWTTLASGIVNLFWGFAASGTAILSVIGIFCAPFAFLPTILGVFELIYAAKLFSNPPQVLKPSTNIAVFEIATLLAGNVFSMAVGILALVFYNDTVVKDYFARLNGTLTPSPVTPVSPASLPQPEVAPVIEELPSPVEESPTKPKRSPRKIAKK
ncbi:MAG TPA: hypothetical protein PLA27_01740 [Anaerolineales bacterium]|jgi:hypothetical protein|nr:hypothetical protein [Anaerolineales bacterium]HQX15113.1 hypothetical protein [Anaerolineales bacterium]